MNPNEFKDTRDRQGSLPIETNRPNKKQRLDRGASDEFADDRADLGGFDDSSKQSPLLDRELGNGQADLTGEQAKETPGWKEQ